MPELRHTLIGLGLKGLSLSGLDRHFGRRFAGLGVILTFHHVRAESDRLYSQNRLLEITPAFFEAVLRLLHELDYEIIRLDEVKDRLEHPRPDRPFAVLTCDDGYLDTKDYALPILKRYDAPMSVFITPGFADRTTPLWWLDLEDAVRALPSVEVSLSSGQFRRPTRSLDEKVACFSALYRRLRALPEPELREVVQTLAARAEIDTLGRVGRLCMDWSTLRDFSREPLITLGAHTLTHPRLKTIAEGESRAEIAGSKARIERELSCKVTQFAYPVGDPTSAGPRDFQLCAEAGMEYGVTTRPGVLYPDHAAHLTALPRLSINGLHQNIDFVRTLVLGLPLHLKNRGRRVNVL